MVLRETTFGRQIYAVGADPEAAAKAGIDVRRIVFSVYCICGVCAAIGGIVSASQVAAASSTFGYQKEFPVIAAAVLGGTSLFGGRGGVLGTVFGAVLIQTVENGLVMINADPYVYPLVISAIIFIAVLVDSLAHRHAGTAGAAPDPDRAGRGTARPRLAGRGGIGARPSPARRHAGGRAGRRSPGRSVTCRSGRSRQGEFPGRFGT